MDALSQIPEFETILVHTGQHYDRRMSELFFDELCIRRPDVNLAVGSGSHAAQTAEIMRRFEPVCVEHRPDWVVVVGDVNSTLACALVAAKLGLRVAHVEAGLRSFDRTMPEEINRVMVDAISDLLFVSEPSGIENLNREGVDLGRVHFVGNVMIDTLLRSRTKADQSRVLDDLRVEPGRYAVVTLHRPGNVDESETLHTILAALEAIGRDMPVIFPVHPRTRGRLEEATRAAGLRFIEPLGYLDFLKLMSNAKIVLTDSGGIQEETTILGVPCLTLRKNTERPITATQGTNRLIGVGTEAILSAYQEVLKRPPKGRVPDRWDGQAALRIAAVFRQMAGPFEPGSPANRPDESGRECVPQMATVES